MKKIKLTKFQKLSIKKKRKGIIEEFKAFVMRGNVVDMATGVIVATAFTKIVTSLTNEIIMPFINFLVSLITKGEKVLLITPLNGKPYFIENVEMVEGIETITKTVNPECIYINWGVFLESILNFLLIAFIIFLIVKTINGIRARMNYLKELAKADEIAKKDKEAREQAEIQAREAAIQLAKKEESDKVKAETESTNALLVEIINLLKK